MSKEQEDTGTEAGPPAKQEKTMKRLWKWIAVAGLAVAVCIGGYMYYQYRLRYPSTDDAYVQANVVRVAAQVAGRVASVPIEDQQRVRKGQLLFRIDSQPFLDRLAAAKAKLAQAKQTVEAEQAAVQAAQAAVADRRAQLDNARRNYRRIRRLAKAHVQPKSKLDDARTTRDSAEANLHLAEAKLHQSKMQLGTPGRGNHQIQQARAAVDEARLNVGYTKVTAPCGGWVSGVKLQKGDTVAAGSPQFALVCSNRFWVYANFKETDLSRIRPGQVATLSVDMYPNHPFQGIVENLNPASGTAFSLLPPENATGNWVKVTQRVPLRILVVDPSPKYPLRVQTSAEVTVDTGSGKKPAGLARNDGLSDKQAERIALSKGLVTSARANRSAGAGAGPRPDPSAVKTAQTR